MPRPRSAATRLATPRALTPIRCGGCGDALGAAAGPASWCPHCRDRWGPVAGSWPAGGGCPGWAAAVYRGRVRRAVLQAKRGAPEAAVELLLARLPAGSLPAGATVCWVPAHPRRSLRRPDAGRRLAAAIAARDGLVVRPLLRRSVLGRRQAGRPDAARRRDPGRLGLRVAVRAVAGPVVLVDDVRTTGTTLDHAAALLRAAGASGVTAVVLAASPRTLEPPGDALRWRVRT